MTPISSRQDRIILQTIRYFNWDKVEKVMKCLDWKWLTKRGMVRPTRFELQQKAYDLLHRSVEFGETGTGGLWAKYYQEDDYEYFELSFNLTDCRIDSEELAAYEEGEAECE